MKNLLSIFNRVSFEIEYNFKFNNFSKKCVEIKIDAYSELLSCIREKNKNCKNLIELLKELKEEVVYNGEAYNVDVIEIVENINKLIEEVEN